MGLPPSSSQWPAGTSVPPSSPLTSELLHGALVSACGSLRSSVAYVACSLQLSFFCNRKTSTRHLMSVSGHNTASSPGVSRLVSVLCCKNTFSFMRLASLQDLQVPLIAQLFALARNRLWLKARTRLTSLPFPSLCGLT